jgi:hypothetical protein
LPPHPWTTDIAALRTDLDAFDSVEMDALVYQGYQLADRFVRRYIGTGFKLDTSPSIAVTPTLMSGPALLRTRAALIAGRSRFFRAFRQRPVLLALCVALLMAGLGGLWQYAPFALSGVGIWVIDQADRFLRWPLLFGGWELLVDDPGSGWPTVIGLLAAAWLWIRWPAFEMSLARGLSRFAPRFLHVALTRVVSVLGLWRRNVFWLLGYAPLALALLGSIFSAGTWLMGRVRRSST